MRASTLLIACLMFQQTAWAELGRIRVSDDGRSFVEESTGKPFVPWGFNYDHDRNGRLIEDYWIDEWETVREDFYEMKQLGANVSRIHLQIGKFLDGPDSPNEAHLKQLAKLIELAHETGIYLDLTGLGNYYKDQVPAWLAELDEQERWDAHAAFWTAVSKTCAGNPAVFFYDLINEPAIPGKGKVAPEWLFGEIGGMVFCQNIVLDPGDRDPAEIARNWTDKMIAAIKPNDSQTLVTIGMLPHEDSGFSPKVLRDRLDFIAVHIYPERNKPEEAQEIVKKFQIGMPLIVEEIFPLAADEEQVAKFMKESSADGSVQGWISFYWGQTQEELLAEDAVNIKVLTGWLTKFQELAKVIAPDQTEAAKEAIPSQP